MKPELFAQKLHDLFVEAGLPSEIDGMVVTLNDDRDNDPEGKSELIFRMDAAYKSWPTKLSIGLPDGYHNEDSPDNEVIEIFCYPK